MKIQNILCPTDFSSLSSQALEHACKLAKQHAARLHIVHVYEPIFTDEYVHGVPPADLGPIQKALESIRPTEPDVECSHELVFGLPAGSIAGYAQTHNIDLIVMGTHGRTGLSHWAFGSVAETVVRWAECAVLTVHEKSARQSVTS